MCTYVHEESRRQIQVLFLGCIPVIFYIGSFPGQMLTKGLNWLAINLRKMLTFPARDFRSPLLLLCRSWGSNSSFYGCSSTLVIEPSPLPLAHSFKRPKPKIGQLYQSDAGMALWQMISQQVHAQKRLYNETVDGEISVQDHASILPCSPGD